LQCLSERASLGAQVHWPRTSAQHPEQQLLGSGTDVSAALCLVFKTAAVAETLAGRFVRAATMWTRIVSVVLAELLFKPFWHVEARAIEWQCLLLRLR
jgi:hypothetical protein